MQSIHIIISNNKYCIIDTSDTGVLRAIDKAFSFKLQNVEYTQAYKNGWDGITHLLNIKTKSLPLGLIDKLDNFLSKIGFKASIEDRRSALTVGPEIDLKPNLAKLNITLWDHQVKIVEAALSKRKGIIRSATGSGKSITIASLVAKINAPTIIYVIGLDLLDQFHQLLSQLFDDVGYIGNGICQIGKKINVMSIWTAGTALGLKTGIINDEEYSNKEIVKIENKKAIVNLLQSSVCHLFDECHTIGTSTFKSIFRQIDPKIIYGFSGTPYRMDGSDLYSHGILGPQLIDIDAEQLITNNILTRPHIKFIRVPKLDTNARDYHSIYKEYVVENNIRNKLIVEKAKMLADLGHSVLVLFRQLKHGKILQELFNNNDITTELLDGSNNLERREEVKNNIKSGKTKITLSSTIFDVGLDLPILSGLVLAGPSRSHNKVLQRIGRCIRKYPGKDMAAVIDFYDDIKYLREHSKIRHKIYCDEPGFRVEWIK